MDVLYEVDFTRYVITLSRNTHCHSRMVWPLNQPPVIGSEVKNGKKEKRGMRYLANKYTATVRYCTRLPSR